MSLADIELEHIISAPITKVSRAIRTPDLVAQWLGCMRYTGELGATFFMQPDPEKRKADSIEGATHCELLALEDLRMVFTWFLPGTPKTTVTIQLEARDDETTVVRLCHAGWDAFPDDAIDAVWQALKGGWAGGVLPNLDALARA